MSDPNNLKSLLDEVWRHLIRGVADSRSPARYPTFVTVSPDNKPEARTVALRGATRSSGELEVHTDIATSKVVALRHAPTAVFHVWLPRADLQIRLTASIQILTEIDVEPQWDRIPAGSRVSYGTLPESGTPIPDVYAYEKLGDRACFAVLKCSLLEMDLLHLGTRHRRAAFVCDDDWAGTWLAP